MRAWLRSIPLVVLTILLGMSATASAGVLYFSFAYTGNGIASAGILTTTDVLVGGAYTITGIQGSRNVNGIGGLLAPGAFGGNDNLLFPGGPFVDSAGLSYLAGGLPYNVGNAATACGSANLYAETNNGFCPGTAVVMNIAPFSPVAGSAYFAYSYTGDGIASAGIMSATGAPVGGAYQVTGLQGLRNGADIAGLLPPGAFGGNDNLLFPAGPFVDSAGFSYLAGGLPYNAGNAATACGSANLYAETSNGFCPGTPVFMNVTALRVPEPASLFLFAVGLAAVGVNRRRRA